MGSPDEKPAFSRNTPQRMLVLETVRSMSNHPTSVEVYNEVRQKNPRISRATVYRNLAFLAETGEIYRVKTPNGADRYDFNTVPHNHAQCRVCGRVFDMPALDKQECLVENGSSTSFYVTACQIFYEGICAQCSSL